MGQNRTPFIFGFYGESNSGKTTLLEKLISQLTREGYRVAAIKQTDKRISMDTPSKNTDRYAQAGASLVAFSSKIETVYLAKQKINIFEIITRIQEMGKFDYIFIEGADEESIPKIRLGSIRERANTLLTYDGDYANLYKKIKRQNIK